MQIPAGLLGLMAAVAIVAAGLIYAARSRYAGLRALPRNWRVVEEGLCVFLAVGMLAAASVQVVARYFFSDEVSIPWTEELSRLLLVWGVLWGATMVQRDDDQIAMTAVYDLLSRPVQFGLQMVRQAVTLACLALIFWYGCDNAANLMGIQTTALGLPLAAFAFAMPVVAAVMFVFTIGTAVRLLRARVRAAERGSA